MIDLLHQKPLLGQRLNRAHPLAKGLLACWLFNEGSGNRVYDYSGNGYNLTLTSMPWVATQKGTGIDGDADEGDLAELDRDLFLTPTMSMFLIVDADTVAPGGTAETGFWRTGALSSQNHFFALERDSGRPMIRWAGTNILIGAADPAYPLGISTSFWQVSSADRFEIWYNGVLEFSDSHAKVTNTSEFIRNIWHIYFTGNDAWMDGRAITFYFYNRWFSPAEITWITREPYAMFQQNRVRWFSIPVGGVTHQLVGSLSGLSALSGDINAKRAVVGTISSAAVLSASLQRTLRITGFFDGLSVISGKANIKRAFIGIINVVSALIGVLNLKKALTGTIPTISSLIGNINLRRSLVGSIDTVAAFVGALIVYVASILRGTIVAISSLSGRVNLEKRLAGTINVVTGISGALIVTKVLAGVVNAVSSLIGKINVKKALSGVSVGVSSLSGLFERRRSILGILSATTALSGSLNIKKRVDGIINAVSTLTAGVYLKKSVSGAVTGTALLSGFINIKRRISGIIAAVSSFVGALFTPAVISPTSIVVDWDTPITIEANFKTAIMKEVEFDTPISKEVDWTTKIEGGP